MASNLEARNYKARDEVKICRALISVSDKTGLLELAKGSAHKVFSWSPPAQPPSRLPMPVWP